MADTQVAEMPLPRHVLFDLGFFGHYLHQNAGGRSGQRHILVKLLIRGGHMTQRELQEAADISSAAISEVLAKLEAAGLVRRTRSDEDRRQLDIALTADGEARATELIEERRAFEAECLTCLDEQEQRQLVGYLDRMVEHWRGLPRKEACA